MVVFGSSSGGDGSITAQTGTPRSTDCIESCWRDAWATVEEPADERRPQPAQDIARQQPRQAPEDEQDAERLAYAGRTSVARWRLPVAPQMIARSTRPPSSGKPGRMLKTPSSRLVNAR